MDAGAWTWLEVAKLVASLLVPLTLAAFGVFVHRITKRFEHMQWRSQKLVEKRLAIYDELAPMLNDVLCYFTYVGGWRDMSPTDVVGLKRKIDKKVHLSAPLFSPAFYEHCSHFLKTCFEMYGGWGKDATLRTQFERRKESRTDWKVEWDACFSPNTSLPSDVREAYQAVMAVMSSEIGVNERFIIPPSGPAPSGRR